MNLFLQQADHTYAPAAFARVRWQLVTFLSGLLLALPSLAFSAAVPSFETGIVFHESDGLKLAPVSEEQSKTPPPPRKNSVTVKHMLGWESMSFAQLAAKTGAGRIKAAAPAVIAAAVPQVSTDRPIVPQNYGPVPLAPAAPLAPKEMEQPSHATAITVRAEKSLGHGRTEVKTATVNVSPSSSLPATNHGASSKPAAAVPSILPPRAELLITRHEGRLSFAPESLKLTALGAKALVKFTADQSADADFEKGLSIFVRDAQVIDWRSKSRELVAKKAGRTELYIVAAEKMYIVPIQIEGSPSVSFDLAVPEALVSLDGLVQTKNAQSAIYPEAAISDALRAPDAAATRPELTLEESIADISKTAQHQEASTNRYFRRAEAVNYSTLTLQVIDDRSQPRAGIVYPVAGARVRVIGTEFSALTNSTGHVVVRDVPRNSRFLVVIDDPSGIVRPALAEVESGPQTDSGVVRAMVAREFEFDALTRIAGAVQDSALSSLCGRAVESRSKANPVMGLRVALDVRADGPYYNNRYGYLDRSATATGADGKFCFFNVDPGPALITFTNGESLAGSLPLSLFSGRHTEDEFILGEGHTIHARLAAIASAHEQLSSNPADARKYTDVDAIDLIPIGEDTPMQPEDDGLVANASPILGHNNRAIALARAPEFEPTVYQFDLRKRRDEQVTPLVPRGFIEDMSIYAQVSFDSTLGAVLVEHGDLGGQGNEPVHLRLVNESGFDVGEGWYFNDSPVTKAIFFNVPAGTYALLVETKNRYWLAAETVVVFSETLSYVQTGSRLKTAAVALPE